MSQFYALFIYLNIQAFMPMDELIAKMRSQITQVNTQKSTESSQDSVIVVKDEIGEINTSQSEILVRNRFKLDFDSLRKYRDGKLEESENKSSLNNSNSIKISEIKDSDALKIEGTLWAIVKSKESYKGVETNVYQWELCDESGVIFGSSLEIDNEITIGTILCLKNFSIWRINGTHLNIVRKNIVKIVNE